MKKELVLGIFVALIIISVFNFVYAQEQGNADNNVGSIKGAGSEIKSKTNEFLEQDITIPENLQIFSQVIFGIQGEIQLNEFIILAAIWFMLFIFLHKILEVVPFFGAGWKSWVGAVIVTCLVSITGAIKNVSDWFYNIAGMIKFLEGMTALKIVVSLIIVGVILFIAFKILDIIKGKAGLETAEMQGLETGVGASILAQQAKTLK